MLEVFLKVNIINPKLRKIIHRRKNGRTIWNGKFSHLEDKIYLTIEFAKKMREEKDKIEREMSSLRARGKQPFRRKKQA